MPLLLICCLAGAEVDALRPEFCGTAGLRRATEDVRLPGDLEINEARSHDRGFQFCFQQSTGNSARPQIDLLFRVRWHRLLHHDIPDLEATAGFEHASHLLQGREFVWQQVEHPVGDDHIGPAIGDGQRLGQAFAELHMDCPGKARTLPRRFEHGPCHIDSDDLSGWADHLRRDQAIDAGTTANIDNPLTGPEVADVKGVAGASERRDRAFGKTFQPVIVIAKYASEWTAGVEVIAATRISCHRCVFFLDRLTQATQVKTGFCL
jgi:hypothetical protein